MKVLQINANYGIGSTGTIVEDIGKTISESGNESYFAYQKTNEKVNNGFVIGNVFDWKIHALLCRAFGRQGYYSSISTINLIHKIKQINPDIVHLHNLHSNYVNIDILFKFLAKKDIATVITMHDCWYFTGKCFHYVDCDCDKFMYECGKCPKKSEPPRSYFFDWSKHDLKNKKNRILSIPRLTIVGCSDWICNETKKSILAKCNIKRIYNGIDTNIFAPSEDFRDVYKIQNDEFVVMGMANKWLQKENIDMLLCVSTLQKTRLMIVGCTKEQIQKIKNINSNIIAVGFIDDKRELAKYYSTADVFVNLTHADTLPTVNMESICCATPVITYDSCGSPELIDKETGIIVKENDEKAIINAIEIARNKNWNKCREVGINRFDKNICYNKYINVYEQLIAFGVCK
jgi:putative colanic acid biosynthesis glycosyltransferase